MKRYPLKRWDDTDMSEEAEAALWGDISFTVFGMVTKWRADFVGTVKLRGR